MKILVVSGFLGAGKTTFISSLMDQTNIKPVILENEYGDDNLDAKALKKDDDTQILEFAEGCVCCTKKDSFINTLLTINASLMPEYLIVEPSGIGKLSNIIENINKITFGDIELLNPLVILSPSQIDNYLRDYPDIYIDQIMNAGMIVFSKIENESNEIIEDAKNKILSYNKNANIITTPYQNKDSKFFQELLNQHNDIELIKNDSPILTNIKQETFINPCLDSVGELIILLEDIIHKEYGDIVRAKGELIINDERIKYDLADNRYGIIASDDDESDCKCVFIGRNIDERKLGNRLNIRNKKINVLLRGRNRLRVN